MAILTGSQIRDSINDGFITIDPFQENQLNPNSYDLRLGRGVKLIENWVYQVSGGGYFPRRDPEPIDLREKINTIDLEMGDRFYMHPGMFYLMHTEERILSDKYIPVLDGKSSIGRVSIKVHFTAGYGDIGFDGQYTLEVECSGPMFIYPGMRIAQVRFHEAHGTIEDYKKRGHYVGKQARGAIGSRVSDQIKEDKI